MNYLFIQSKNNTETSRKVSLEEIDFHKLKNSETAKEAITNILNGREKYCLLDNTTIFNSLQFCCVKQSAR